MAEQDATAAPPAGGRASREDRDFGRRAARAELEAQAIEDERRELLSMSEQANYARAHGEPIAKGE